MKYVDTTISYKVIPDEISLVITISECSYQCPNCNLPHLQKDIGKILNWNVLKELIKSNKGITCICFYGGDELNINLLAENIRRVPIYDYLKIAWYTGADDITDVTNFDYIKLGKYDVALTNPNTTQHFYEVCKIHKLPIRYILMDRTHLFWN